MLLDKIELATIENSKLRLCIYGISGSGKTLSSLKIAQGLGGKILVIDTERGSASKYADKNKFFRFNLKESTVDNYIEILEEASGKYDVLIIDSLSHAWQNLLDINDDLARLKYKGNSFASWRETSKKQKKLISAILDFDGHVIATMRSKTEWQVGDGGKVNRLGMSPEQGKGIEYEFDILGEMSDRHELFIQKDRSGRFQDKVILKPDEKFGEEIKDWLRGTKKIDDTFLKLKQTYSTKLNNDETLDNDAKKYYNDKIEKATDVENLKKIGQEIKEFKEKQNEIL